MLLHAPKVARHVSAPNELMGAGLAGTELLIEIIEFAAANPNVSSGVLVERWREHPLGQHLQKLLVSELATPEEGIEVEFVSAITRIRAQGEKVRRSELTRKPLKDMTEEEKNQLRSRPAPES